MKELFFVLGINFLACCIYMLCLWPISLIKRDASIADIFWGLGFVIVAWITFFLSDGYLWRKLIIASLATLWGLRLSIHIFLRHRGKGEDPRYGAMREHHGDKFWWRSLFTVFGLQAFLLWVVSITLQMGQVWSLPGELTWLDGAGIFIWLVGFAFETVSDWQLNRFLSDPANRGEIMNRGLWSYSRHPNYFGESLVWWGLFLITLATPHGFWAIISPLTISYLLVKVSGVPMLEKAMLDIEPVKYRAYMDKTSAFIPWPPKNNDGETP
jgi:steroid 5-alpha reductase family enzyme